MSNEQQKPDGSGGEQEGGSAERPNGSEQQVSGERPAGSEHTSGERQGSAEQKSGGERHGGSERHGGAERTSGRSKRPDGAERTSGSSGRSGGAERTSGGSGRPGGASRQDGGGNREGGDRMRPRGQGSQQQRSQQRPQDPRRTFVSGKLVELFRAGDESTQDLIQLAHDFASQTGHVKHHQLRNLLDLVIWAKQSHHDGRDSVLEAPVKGRLACLRPRVAYMAARERGLLSLRDELDLLLKDKEAFTRGADLDRLYSFVAAVVAYHKFEEVTREHQRSK